MSTFGDNDDVLNLRIMSKSPQNSTNQDGVQKSKTKCTSKRTYENRTNYLSGFFFNN